MDSLLSVNVILAALSIVWGILEVWGGIKNWKWLVDPPDYLGAIYPNAFMNTLYGPEFTRKYTIASGIFFLIVGIKYLLLL